MNLELFKQRNVIPYSAVFSKKGEFLPDYRNLPFHCINHKFLPILYPDTTCSNIEQILNKEYSNKFIFDVYSPYTYQISPFIIVAIYDIKEPCCPLKPTEINNLHSIQWNIEMIAESYHDYERLEGYEYLFVAIEDEEVINQYGGTILLLYNDNKIEED